MAKTRSSSQVSRRDVLSVGAVMTGIGVAGPAFPLSVDHYFASPRAGLVRPRP